MKGPYERLKYDLRRLWECPVCKRRERTPGTVTFRHCACGTETEGGQPVVMLLIGDGAQRLVPVIAAARGQCREEDVAVPALVPDAVATVMPAADVMSVEVTDVGVPQANALADSDSCSHPGPLAEEAGE
jgi:hypothetical protein